MAGKDWADLDFDEDEEKVCPNCGHTYDEAEKACPHCGAIVSQEDDELDGFQEDEES